MDAKFVDVRPPRLGRDVQKSLRDFCRTRWVRPHTLLRKNKKPQDGAFYFYMAERVGFEPTDGTLEIKMLPENWELLVPSGPLASPFVPVDSASSSVISQIKFNHEKSRQSLGQWAVTHNLSQTFGYFLRLLSAVEHAKHDARHVSPSTLSAAPCPHHDAPVSRNASWCQGGDSSRASSRLYDSHSSSMARSFSSRDIFRGFMRIPTLSRPSTAV
jgi:hypothetical protein